MHRPLTGKLVIATHNPGKLVEMRELLAPHGVEAVSAGELGLGEPEEIARCVVFLASDDAGLITGSTLTANGGQYVV